MPSIVVARKILVGLRVGEKRIGQIAHKPARRHRAENASHLCAVVRRVIDKLADARAPVVRRDEQILVRPFTRPLNCADELIGCGCLRSHERFSA